MGKAICVLICCTALFIALAGISVGTGLSNIQSEKVKILDSIK